MFKKSLLIFLCIILTTTCFAGCSLLDEYNDEDKVGVQVQVQEEREETEENTDEKSDYKYTVAQGVQTYKTEEVVAIKYLAYKVDLISAFDKSFPQKAEGQIIETLEDYLEIFGEKKIETFIHDTVKVVQKNKQNYILESGKINGYNFKGIYSVSAQDSDFIIMSLYIELDEDTSGIDAIVSQSFDLEDFK